MLRPVHTPQALAPEAATVGGDGFSREPAAVVVGGGPAFSTRAAQRVSLAYNQHRLTNAMALAVGDAIAFALGFALAGALRWWWLGAAGLPDWIGALLVPWWISALVFRLLPGWGLGPVEEMRRTVALMAGFFGLVSALLFVAQSGEAHSRFTVGVGFLFSLGLVLLMRTQVKRWLIGWDLWGVPVAIYGHGQVAAQTIRLLREEAGLGYRPVVVLSNDGRGVGGFVEGLPVLGPEAEVHRRVPVAIAALSHADRDRLTRLLEGPALAFSRVLIVLDLFDVPSLWVRPRDLNGVLGLEVQHHLMGPLVTATKRVLDVLLVGGTSPAWGLLCLLIGLGVWLEDRQHPLYSQERHGRGGRSFRAWKFRTMVPDADAALERYLRVHPGLRAEWEANHKLKEDPRITRVGRFLRKTSLDELPQLVNVLRGEMSLVGPRPLPGYHVDRLSHRLRVLRHRVRPGITGLWQVSGRSDAGNAGLERWDAYYVRNWSLWLDIVILVRTVRTVLRGEGAY